MDTYARLEESLDTSWFTKADDIKANNTDIGVAGYLFLSEEGKARFGIKPDEYAIAEAIVSPDGKDGVFKIHKLDEDELIETVNYEKPSTYEEYVFAKQKLDREFEDIPTVVLKRTATSFDGYSVSDENVKPVLSLFNESLGANGISLTCEEILDQMSEKEDLYAPKPYANDDASGIMMNIPVNIPMNGEGTPHVVTAYAATYVDYDKAVPYTYTNANLLKGEFDTDELKKVDVQVQLKLLETLSERDDDLGRWASGTLEAFKELNDLLVEYDGERFDYTLPNGDEMRITPCEDVPDSKDYTFFLTDHPLVDSAWNLLEIAEKANTMGGLEKQRESAIERLQSFYEDKILPLRDVPAGKLTAEQKEDYGFFSDYHKDIYGIRPRNDDRNMCYQAYIAKSSAEKPAKSAKPIERD